MVCEAEMVVFREISPENYRSLLIHNHIGVYFVCRYCAHESYSHNSPIDYLS